MKDPYKRLSSEWGSKARKQDSRAAKSTLKKIPKEEFDEISVERELQGLAVAEDLQFRRVLETAELLEKELAALYEPLVTAKIAAKDWPGAFEVIIKMPDCVSRVFFVDRIRNARRDYK
jgi:hypothetical protein